MRYFVNNMISLVVATRNLGKTNEIRRLLDEFPIKIYNMDDFGTLPEVDEDGKTFEENAYKKASFAARILGLPALADDSGLIVAALDGAPGIYSARYAGENATSEQLCDKILYEMEGETSRTAAFECVISLAVPKGYALTYEARCEGIIANSAIGTNGFGYDPIFYYPSLKKTFAELSVSEKNKISHRGKALNELRSEFANVLKWIKSHM